MAEVSVTINGRVYRMACDPGQEDHLARLGRELDQRISQLRDSFGEIGDTRLAVMAAIMVADELAELKRRLRSADQEIQSLKDARERAAQRNEEGERTLAEILETTAERIERLAQGLNSGPNGGVALG
ncbi:MAG: cell division protein ZapA [Xanthobacteraceae bacterium]|nr:cell division protein ZapA [Xanthobacteraceae bacterium]MBX3522306.1 cell division protein ZapA [Xanthobacteraceae bacterium]MBX3534967.1 cell division protein ZapA [Xanthobacteraceae bacterium]MBX3549677.1 cell division protein ZapA [Xanthobacteraceae bacterium]MCW5675122.1 cell division protein ZapA [Xanthobacteraceae bacterium]